MKTLALRADEQGPPVTAPFGEEVLGMPLLQAI
jgi:hypothetical protein